MRKRKSRSDQSFSRNSGALGPLTILLALALAACTRPSADSLARLPFPTKDDVAIVDGRPLTITTFLNIRSRLDTPSTEKAFWVGVAALAIQKELEAHKQPLATDTALNVSFYAIGALPPNDAAPSLKAFFGSDSIPTAEEVRHKIDQLVARSIVQRNPQVLASF